MATEAVIFDLDGTVWNSVGWFAAALANDPKEAQELEQRLATTGNIVHEISKAGITRPRFLREANKSGPPPLFDGILGSLNALSERGIPLAVATSLPGTLALPMLLSAGLTNLFKAVIHAGNCRMPKPNPASIRKALTALDVRPSHRTYYVGDRGVDIEAALRAGVSPVWVKHGYETPKLAADVLLLDAFELAEI